MTHTPKQPDPRIVILPPMTAQERREAWQDIRLWIYSGIGVLIFLFVIFLLLNSIVPAWMHISL